MPTGRHRPTPLGFQATSRLRSFGTWSKLGRTSTPSAEAAGDWSSVRSRCTTRAPAGRAIRTGDWEPPRHGVNDAFERSDLSATTSGGSKPCAHQRRVPLPLSLSGWLERIPMRRGARGTTTAMPVSHAARGVVNASSSRHFDPMCCVASVRRRPRRFATVVAIFSERRTDRPPSSSQLRRCPRWHPQQVRCKGDPKRCDHPGHRPRSHLP